MRLQVTLFLAWVAQSRAEFLPSTNCETRRQLDMPQSRGAAFTGAKKKCRDRGNCLGQCHHQVVVDATNGKSFPA